MGQGCLLHINSVHTGQGRALPAPVQELFDRLRVAFRLGIDRAVCFIADKPAYAQSLCLLPRRSAKPNPLNLAVYPDVEMSF